MLPRHRPPPSRGQALGKGGADPGGDDAALRFAGIGHGIAHEVDAAALPGGAEYLGDGCLQSFMRIGDDQLDATQAASGQTAQELGPEWLGLAVADGHTEHFPPAVGVDCHGNDHGHGYYMMVPPRFDVAGIQPEIGPVALDRSM